MKIQTPRTSVTQLCLNSVQLIKAINLIDFYSWFQVQKISREIISRGL